VTAGVVNGAALNALAINAGGAVSLSGGAAAAISLSLRLSQRARAAGAATIATRASTILRGRLGIPGAAAIRLDGLSDAHARKVVAGWLTAAVPPAAALLLRRGVLRGSSSMRPVASVDLEYEFLHVAAAARRFPPAREFRALTLPLERRCFVVPAAGAMHHPSERLRS